MNTFAQRVFSKKSVKVVSIAAIFLALAIGVLPFTTFASFGSNANPTTVLKGSYLKAEEF